MLIILLEQLILVRRHPTIAQQGAADQHHKPQRTVETLWQHRRSKAIDRILNNSMFPSPPPTVNDTTDVYKYYTAKCQSTPDPNAAPQASAAVVTDPSVTTEATVYHNEAQHTLHNTTARRLLLNMKQTDQTTVDWTGMPRLSQPLCFPLHARCCWGGHPLLHCQSQTAGATKHNLSLRYPAHHHPHCIMTQLDINLNQLPIL